jgi:hypothetical protein
MNYQELIGEYREVEQTKTLDEGTIRLYKVLVCIQIVSLGIVTGCALAVIYFG